MYQLSDGDIVAVTYSVRHGSGYRMAIHSHHSVVSCDTMVVPMRRYNLWDACRRIAIGKQLPHAPVLQWGDATVAIIESTGQHPIPLPSGLYSLLPVRILCKPYDLTCDMMQWLGIPSHMAGVYTGRSHAYNTVLPVRI
jgi:hypothetical protein